MYLVNYLSRAQTDQFHPVFEIIYTAEIIAILLAFAAGVAVINLSWKTKKLHRLIRLRIIDAICVALVYLLSRLLVMQHEYFGEAEYVETPTLIFGSMMKQIFLGYMTGLLSVLALDRFVATKAWAWYESSTITTVYFFVIQDTILFTISSSIAFLLVHDYIQSMDVVHCYAVLVTLGTVSLTLVFLHNQRVMRELKRGAEINKYSVSRTYQIRENIALLTSVKSITRPLVAVCIPPFVFYPIFHQVPENIGYDELRYFSAAMYDLWLSIACVVVITAVPFYFPRLRRHWKLSVMHVSSISSSVQKSDPETGDIYFALLSKDLGKRLSRVV